MSAILNCPPPRCFSAEEIAAATDAALRRIPPLWPLRHFVAVNPFLGLVDRPFPEACALLQRVVGAAPLQAPADYRQAFRDGRITAEDLAAAGDARESVDPDPDDEVPERPADRPRRAGSGSAQSASASPSSMP